MNLENGSLKWRITPDHTHLSSTQVAIVPLWQVEFLRTRLWDGDLGAGNLMGCAMGNNISEGTKKAWLTRGVWVCCRHNKGLGQSHWELMSCNDPELSQLGQEATSYIAAQSSHCDAGCCWKWGMALDKDSCLQERTVPGKGKSFATVK